MDSEYQMRYLRLLFLPVIMLAVAGLLAVWGVGILLGSGSTPWIGWLLIGVAVI